MTATIEPARVTAGDTVSWLKSLSEYPATDGWVLSYTFINASGKIEVAAAASGADHLVLKAAADTAAWAAGEYAWQAVVTKGADRYTVGTGQMVVAPNMAAAATLDTRSSAKKALDAVNALLEQYGTKAYLQGYEIAGRRMQFHTPGEFLAYRSKLVAEVARETNAARLAAGLAPRNQVAVRFRR